MAESVAERVVTIVAGGRELADEWTWESFEPLMLDYFGIVPDLGEDRLKLDENDFKTRVLNCITDYYERREQEFGSEKMRELERVVLLACGR